VTETDTCGPRGGANARQRRSTGELGLLLHVLRGQAKFADVQAPRREVDTIEVRRTGEGTPGVRGVISEARSASGRAAEDATACHDRWSIDMNGVWLGSLLSILVLREGGAIPSWRDQSGVSAPRIG
jgi:hypothetical protein